MGHLMEAVLIKNKEVMEKELLHVAAPLLELYSEISTGENGTQNKLSHKGEKEC